MTTDNRFNAARAARASSNRSFALGPYAFKRRLSVPPEVIIGFNSAVSMIQGDDSKALETLDDTIASICEGVAIDTRTGLEVPFVDAWGYMRHTGDEYGVIDLNDLRDVCEWLVSGVVERPTLQPSDSSDGSPTPTPGMPSMGGLPSPEPASTISTPDGVAMRSTPA